MLRCVRDGTGNDKSWQLLDQCWLISREVALCKSRILLHVVGRRD